MKTKLLLGSLAMMLLAACSSDMKDVVEVMPALETGLKYMEFTASTGADTRTLLTDDNNVVWVNGDAISIFDGTANRRFTTKDNGPSAVFGGEAKEANVYYALYPYQEGATIQGSLIKNVTIPVVQEAKAGSFESGNNISVASASKDLHLAFKNVGSLMKFSMTNDKAADVRTVKLTSNGENAMLAGTVNINVGATPTVTAVSGQSQVTLKSDNGFEKDKDYYFMVLPSTLSEGFSLTFTDKDNKTWRKTYTAEANMSRSNILKLNDIELGNFTTGLLSNVNLIAAAEASTGQAFTKNADGTVDLNNANNRAIVEAVTTLDVSDKNDATIANDLCYFTGLKVLNCSGNNITALDMTTNTALEELYCYGEEHFVKDESIGWDGTLKQLNVTSNKNLRVLNVMGNQLKSIDISHNIFLTHLWTNDNYELGTLEISNNKELLYLNAGQDGLAILDVTNNTKLIEMFVSDNYNFTIIGLSNLLNIKQLELANNGITDLDVSMFKSLEKLNCDGNHLEHLDFSPNTELVWLRCTDNSMKTIDVSKNTKLTYLATGTNLLENLDITHNTELEYMDCDNNFLTSLDLSQNTKLKEIIASCNHLSTLDISRTSLKLSDMCWVGSQRDSEGYDLMLTLYVNATQYNGGELSYIEGDYYKGNLNVNVILKAEADHEGFNENNYGY